MFSQAGTPKVVAEIQAVGTTSECSQTWLWGWANESLISAATKQMSRVRQFGIDNGIRQLSEASLPNDEHLGWELTAVSVALLNGKGAYRCPRNDGGHLYFVYTDIAFAELPSPHAGPAEEQQQIQCGQHGRGHSTYVCEHLFVNPKQQWFSDHPSPEKRWPDAWCAGCDRLYQNEGEWNDANSEHLKIKLICHHCYEGIKLMQAGNSFREDF